jgi:exosortase
MKKTLTTNRVTSLAHYRVPAALVGLLGCLLWSYWPTIVELCEFWGRNQDYSVGALVPLVALYLVWRQRATLQAEPAQPCWWGLLVLAFAEALRQLGTYYGVGSGERYALIASLAGVVLLAAGWRVCRRLTWVFAFLLLMIPLPARVHETLSLPLQYKATTSAVFALELLGFFVVREGNVLRLNDQTSVAVAEACSGLRMLTAFVFVAAVLAFLIPRPRWQKLLLLLFSLPIAVLSNSLRLVLTSLFIHYSQDSGLSEKFHDAAGLAMMPLALFFSVALLKFFALLSAPAQVSPPAALPGGQGVRVAADRSAQKAGATRGCHHVAADPRVGR